MASKFSSSAALERFESQMNQKAVVIQNAEEELQLETIKPRRKAVLEGMIEKARMTIGNILQKRTEVRNIIYTENQKQDFGVEAWGQRFIRLSDIETIDGYKEEGAQLRLLLWNTFSNCRFKRFQELFCKPEDFCLPRFRVLAGKLVFDEEKSIDDLPLAATLVDIDRVPDKLLIDLHLVEYTEEDKDPVKHLAKKGAAIPRLKEVFERAKRITDKNERVLIIQYDDRQEQSIEEKVRGAPKETEGAILYIRSDERKTKKPVQQTGFIQRVVQFFPDAYSAQRKTRFEENVYNAEINDLAGLTVKLENMNGELNRNWKKNTPNADKIDMRYRTNELFEQCVSVLEHCQNSYKVKASKHVTKIKEMMGIEIEEAPNVPAAMAAMVGAKNAIFKRQHDMRMKGRFNQDDRYILEEGLRTHEHRFLEYDKGVQAIAGRFNMSLAIFTQPLAPEKTEATVSGFLKPIHTDLLSKISLAPFISYAVRLREKYDILASAIAQQDKKKAQEVLIQMHVIIKFLEVQKTFEVIKRDVMDPALVSVARIRSFISELTGVFSAFQIFPHTTVESYAPAFTHMQEQLIVIQNTLLMYETKDMDIPQRTQMYKRLKDYLDTFDIPKIVEELE